MVLITWKPQLTKAIKEIKKLDNTAFVSLFKDSKYVNKLQLSYAEEKSFRAVILDKKGTEPNAIFWV